MSDYQVVLSDRAKQRLSEIAAYLYEQSLSKEFVVNYLNSFESWLEMLLTEFPESGTLMPDYGKNVRRVVYKKYSFLYRVNGVYIEVLTIYRDNLP
jgi:plasmid stabilization system protein ParE